MMFIIRGDFTDEIQWQNGYTELTQSLIEIYVSFGHPVNNVKTVIIRLNKLLSVLSTSHVLIQLTEAGPFFRKVEYH